MTSQRRAGRPLLRPRLAREGPQHAGRGQAGQDAIGFAGIDRLAERGAADVLARDLAAAARLQPVHDPPGAGLEIGRVRCDRRRPLRARGSSRTTARSPARRRPGRCRPARSMDRTPGWRTTRADAARRPGAAPAPAPCRARRPRDLRPRTAPHEGDPGTHRGRRARPRPGQGKAARPSCPPWRGSRAGGRAPRRRARACARPADETAATPARHRGSARPALLAALQGRRQPVGFERAQDADRERIERTDGAFGDQRRKAAGGLVAPQDDAALVAERTVEQRLDAAAIHDAWRTALGRGAARSTPPAAALSLSSAFSSRRTGASAGDLPLEGAPTTASQSHSGSLHTEETRTQTPGAADTGDGRKHGLRHVVGRDVHRPGGVFDPCPPWKRQRLEGKGGDGERLVVKKRAFDVRPGASAHGTGRWLAMDQANDEVPVDPTAGRLGALGSSSASSERSLAVLGMTASAVIENDNLGYLTWQSGNVHSPVVPTEREARSGGTFSRRYSGLSSREGPSATLAALAPVGTTVELPATFRGRIA